MYVPGMTSRKLSVALLGAALALSACSGAEDEAVAASSSSSAIPEITTAEVVEELSDGGPAPETADFGKGVTARIVSVTAAPADQEVHPGEGDTLVRITVEIAYNGEGNFRFPEAKMYVSEDLAYGVNGYDATSWFADEGGSTELPAMLAPGTSATTVSDHTLPAEELEELTFTFNPNSESLSDWVFTDVEELIS